MCEQHNRACSVCGCLVSRRKSKSGFQIHWTIRQRKERYGQRHSCLALCSSLVVSCGDALLTGIAVRLPPPSQLIGVIGEGLQVGASSIKDVSLRLTLVDDGIRDVRRYAAPFAACSKEPKACGVRQGLYLTKRKQVDGLLTDKALAAFFR